jgi:hypothetical protein
LVQGDEGPAQSLPRRRPGSFGWGIAALHRLKCSDEVAISLYLWRALGWIVVS